MRARGAAMSHQQSLDNSVEQCRCEKQGNSFDGFSSIASTAKPLRPSIPNIDKYGSLLRRFADRYHRAQHISSDGITQH